MQLNVLQGPDNPSHPEIILQSFGTFSGNVTLGTAAGEREKVIVGRVIVAVLVGVSLCWLPIIQGKVFSL